MINIEQTKSLIVEKLKSVDPEMIILFGSYAYGTPNEDSDLDLCIVEKKVDVKIEEKRKIRALLGDIRIGKDILVPDLDEFNFYKKEKNSVYNEIDQKGVIIWQKG